MKIHQLVQVATNKSNCISTLFLYRFTIQFNFLSAILFGLVERICPADPIPELSEIRSCRSDLDCNPRICCPDKPNVGGQVKFYCRTAAANLDKLPAPKMIVERMFYTIKYILMRYIQQNKLKSVELYNKIYLTVLQL